MNNYLMEGFNIASMEEKSLQKNCFIKFNCKTNIGLERGGQTHLSIITHLILIEEVWRVRPVLELWLYSYVDACAHSTHCPHLLWKGGLVVLALRLIGS